MSETISFEVFYPHSPERVWRALTDPRELSKWMMPTDLHPVVGRGFFMAIDTMKVVGQVLEAEQGRRLRFSWDDGEAGCASVVTWDLQPKNGGTLLRLEHRIDIDDSPVLLLEARGNWGALLGTALPSYLRRQPVPIVFVQEEPEHETGRRAGFRQEVSTCG